MPDAVADVEALEMGRGALHLLEHHRLTVLEPSDHRSPDLKPLGLLEGPVGVRDAPIRLEMEPSTVHDHGPEEPLPLALDELEGLGEPSPILLGAHPSPDPVAVEKWVQGRWRNESGVGGSPLGHREKPEAPRMHRDMSFDLDWGHGEEPRRTRARPPLWPSEAPRPEAQRAAGPIVSRSHCTPAPVPAIRPPTRGAGAMPL